MDLPTCPACGQSVLDDDAAECPFCGAAMDGSSAPSKPAGGTQSAAPKTDAPKETPSKDVENDDPFAIEKPKTPRKVVPCAPRPMKSRTHKVICPMCDTPGFIPPAAVGRAVKCANKECMVPVFTADETSQKGKAAAPPTRVSDQDQDGASKVVREPGEKNPLVLWGIVGGVLVACTVGGLMFLKPDTSKENELNRPVDMSKFQNLGDDSEDETATTTALATDPPKVVQESSTDLAERLVERMVTTARQTGNRDKAFCRSLTGGVYLRLGKTQEAEREFAQLKRVSGSGSRQTEYYKIAPLIEHYFRLQATEDANADTYLNQALALKDELPTTGSQTFDAGIRLAAAMMVSGKADEAKALVEGLQKDQSIVAQIDMIRTAAWASTSRKLWDADLQGFSPMSIQQWNEPLKAAVGVWLAARGEMEAAVAWTSSLTNSLTQSDTAAAVANVMRQQASDASVKQSLLDAVASADPKVQLRICSALSASTDDPSWKQATQLLNGVSVGSPNQLPDIQQVILAQVPDTLPDVLTIQALGDFAAAASRLKDEPSTSKALGLISKSGLTTVPTAADLRQASRELAQSEDDVRDRIQEELKLSGSNKVRSRFLAYRRSVDRLSKAAEERRLQLIFALGRVAEEAGVTTIQNAIDNDESLRKEVELDVLKDWISICATARAQSLQILKTDPAARVPFTRTEAPPEWELMGPLGTFWTQYQESGSFETAAQLADGDVLQGFRAATLGFLAHQRFSKPDVTREVLLSLSSIKNPLWRENCIEIAAWSMTRAGRFKEVEETLNEVSVSPTQTIVAFFGAIRALDL